MIGGMFGGGDVSGATASTPGGYNGYLGWDYKFETLSMKNSSSMGEPQVNIVINNQSSADIQTQEKTGADGSRFIEMMITNKVTEVFSSGQMDKTMNINYGLKRRGV
jgi:hypothetical protein